MALSPHAVDRMWNLPRFGGCGDRQSLWSLCPLVAASELTSRESLREASTMDGALSKLLKPPTSQREGPCMLEHHEAGRAF